MFQSISSMHPVSDSNQAHSPLVLPKNLSGKESLGDAGGQSRINAAADDGEYI
jgi:hypothetical protein